MVNLPKVGEHVRYQGEAWLVIELCRRDEKKPVRIQDRSGYSVWVSAEALGATCD